LALNKTASQASTFGTDTASQAVDGLDTHSCTNGHVHPWWSVDLGATYDIGHVTVTHDTNPNQGNYRRTCCVYFLLSNTYNALDTQSQT